MIDIIIALITFGAVLLFLLAVILAFLEGLQVEDDRKYLFYALTIYEKKAKERGYNEAVAFFKMLKIIALVPIFGSLFAPLIALLFIFGSDEKGS